MPAQILRLEIMDEDQLMEEVLDKFVNSHEQTYEEFLSTFTHLSKENNVTEKGAFGPVASGNTFTSLEFTHKNELHDHHLRNTSTFLCTSSECLEEEQIVLDEGQKVGSFFQGDLNRAGKVKVNNFLDLEDLDVDEMKPQTSKDLVLLPGEVEEDISSRVPSYIPSVRQPCAAEMKLKPAIKGREQKEEVGWQLSSPYFWARSSRTQYCGLVVLCPLRLYSVEPGGCTEEQGKGSSGLLPGHGLIRCVLSDWGPWHGRACADLPVCSGLIRCLVCDSGPWCDGYYLKKYMILGDEVQPFSLDEDFDYDSVTLTPKFTSAEIETIKELLKQERNNTNADMWGPHN
ncbi:hypothetical protein GW7_01376 [Heterocephalus glaber]|uniref:Intraflagellar transport-associated protein n=1 Tax=Heterocephalus glaber TaxID=10181 RepID=G5B129_HETGA|nr:hypothetical protein GW7_01376 [Heterocephalus glaber]